MELGGAALQQPSLDAVRALHQTVVALRAALEQSKNEIIQLKSQSVSHPPPLAKTTKKTNKHHHHQHQFEAKIILKNLANHKSSSLESLLKVKCPALGRKRVRVAKTVSFSNLATLFPEKMNNNAGDESQTNNDVSVVVTAEDEENLEEEEEEDDEEQDQEVDDIELIFTTDETKESDFKEQLVSIDSHTDTLNNLLQCPAASSDLLHEQNLDVSDRELDDDVFNDAPEIEFQRENSQLYNSRSDNSINNHENKSLKSCYSYQDSSFENKSLEKDESFDRFEERIRIVETDISKCGIQEVEYGGLRRNTCPNPLQYRPLVHREALGKGLSANKRTRPILAHSNAIRKESGAQTDISALPGAAWLSENNLAGKSRSSTCTENFPTLPSKYPLPGTRLRLSEKTVEARRVLLSDIGFTSMVPELSRSADHLFPQNVKPSVVTSYGQFLKTSDFHSPGFTSQKFTWTTTTATPSDASYSQSRFNSMYPLPSSSVPSSRRCSAPVSPSRRQMVKAMPSKVRFANGSLPELRSDWTAVAMDSGDSTDSLVEEAENYLRRSIDCIMTSRDHDNYCCEGKKAVPRRASAPEPSGDNVPPQGWQPFLPRVPRDLKPDHWVKVITPEGRVRGGRVRYIGPVVTQNDSFVGVQLSSPDGHSDGTFSTRRYFQCEPYHGIFVPFKKVIMGWRP